MKFFEGVWNEEELKITYRKLVKTHHPDKGGNTEIMKMINYQYARYLKAFQYKPQSLHEVKVGCTVFVNNTRCIVTKVEETCFSARSLKTFRETFFSKSTGYAILNFNYKASLHCQN
ncbi:MAG: hypothetical protein JXB34_13845 [Bacteroidales bacterium]|nr:hypothetical protein [Bacteroidales bacterium]